MIKYDKFNYSVLNFVCLRVQLSAIVGVSHFLRVHYYVVAVVVALPANINIVLHLPFGRRWYAV